jgi:hypothetical protein
VWSLGQALPSCDFRCWPSLFSYVKTCGVHVDTKALVASGCWEAASRIILAKALPRLSRLHRTLKECKQRRTEYHKKSELAREMPEVFVSWTNTDRWHAPVGRSPAQLRDCSGPTFPRRSKKKEAE